LNTEKYKCFNVELTEVPQR